MNRGAKSNNIENMSANNIRDNKANPLTLEQQVKLGKANSLNIFRSGALGMKEKSKKKGISFYALSIKGLGVTKEVKLTIINGHYLKLL